MSDPDRTVGPSELAEALEVSERHVYRLARHGLPKVGRGEYPLVRCARWYRTHVLSSNGDEDAPDLGDARLRKARTRAVEAERKLAPRKDEVVPADVWDQVAAEGEVWIRRTVLGLAETWTDALEGLDTPQEIQQELRERVRGALEALQEGPPEWNVNETGEAEDERAA